MAIAGILFEKSLGCTADPIWKKTTLKAMTNYESTPDNAKPIEL